MSIGEIRLFASDRIPRGWAPCDGRVLPVSAFQSLFAVIGYRYGGDGAGTFALPDLRGRAVVGSSRADGPYPLGKQGGAERVQLAPDQMPIHDHQLACQTTTGTSDDPSGGVWAVPAIGIPVYTNAEPVATMHPKALGVTGGGAEHDNMMPSLGLNFIIAISEP